MKGTLRATLFRKGEKQDESHRTSSVQRKDSGHDPRRMADFSALSAPSAVQRGGGVHNAPVSVPTGRLQKRGVGLPGGVGGDPAGRVAVDAAGLLPGVAAAGYRASAGAGVPFSPHEAGISAVSVLVCGGLCVERRHGAGVAGDGRPWLPGGMDQRPAGGAAQTIQQRQRAAVPADGGGVSFPAGGKQRAVTAQFPAGSAAHEPPAVSFAGASSPPEPDRAAALPVDAGDPAGRADDRPSGVEDPLHLSSGGRGEKDHPHDGNLSRLFRAVHRSGGLPVVSGRWRCGVADLHQHHQ